VIKKHFIHTICVLNFLIYTLQCRVLFLLCLFAVYKLTLIYYCLLGIGTINADDFNDEPDSKIIMDQFNIADLLYVSSAQQ